MLEPTFVKTRYRYDSYTDFWKLVELSGFPTCYVDQIDLEKEGLFITSPINGELRPHMDYRRSILKGPQKPKIVWWNLERPDSNGVPLSSGKYAKENDEIFRYVDAIWVSDRYLQTLDSRTTFAVLGSHVGLAESVQQPKTYDFAVMSYINPRRETILSQLRDFRSAPNAWGVERAHILAGTPIMLNIHQTDAPICEPLRFALAAAYGMTLVSETCADPWPLVRDDDVVTADYGDLAVVARRHMSQKHDAFSGRLRKKLAIEWNFIKGVEDALGRTRL
jgi:hypothetical protein